MQLLGANGAEKNWGIFWLFGQFRHLLTLSLTLQFSRGRPNRQMSDFCLRMSGVSLAGVIFMAPAGLE